MSRKVIAVILALALAIGTTIIVTAAENTKGDIKFKAGEVIIVPPDKPDPEPDPEDPVVDLGGNFWFGEHEMRALSDDVNNEKAWGMNTGFNSRILSDGKGEHTGILVISGDTNREIGVSIGGFYVGAEGAQVETLRGFTLLMIPKELATSNPETVKGNQPVGVGLKARADGNQGDAKMILECHNAGKYWATWYGNLDILADTAVAKGNAQAVLNWTVFNVVTP